jgi:hypothetical protein
LKGRRKKKKLTKIAVYIECTDEFCWKCKLLDSKRFRRGILLYCKFFRKSLSPAFGESIAERCSDCHMSQRIAGGENGD